MSCQAQSMFGSTSHLPLVEPPHGPLNSCFEHRATGQTPPVNPRTQSPQPWQRSAQTP